MTSVYLCYITNNLNKNSKFKCKEFDDFLKATAFFTINSLEKD
jgi:hypothetical protein